MRCSEGEGGEGRVLFLLLFPSLRFAGTLLFFGGPEFPSLPGIYSRSTAVLRWRPRPDRGRAGGRSVSLWLRLPFLLGPSPPLLAAAGGAALRPLGAQSRIVGGFMMQHFWRKEEPELLAQRQGSGRAAWRPARSPLPDVAQPRDSPSLHPRRAAPCPDSAPAPAGPQRHPRGSSRRYSAGCLGRSRASASSRRRRGGSTQAREEESRAGRHAGAFSGGAGGPDPAGLSGGEASPLGLGPDSPAGPAGTPVRAGIGFESSARGFLWLPDQSLSDFGGSSSPKKKRLPTFSPSSLMGGGRESEGAPRRGSGVSRPALGSAAALGKKGGN